MNKTLKKGENKYFNTDMGSLGYTATVWLNGRVVHQCTEAKSGREGFVIFAESNGGNLVLSEDKSEVVMRKAKGVVKVALRYHHG